MKFDPNPDYRQILKVCSRAIENFEYLKIAKENPDRLILANRCVYDVLTYNNVYYKKGWIDKSTRDLYDAHTYDFFRDENKNPRAIILNPNLEKVLEHLEKRWSEKGKKWREEDLDYAKFACEEYEKLRFNDNIYYIDHEIDLKSTIEIRKVSEWMNNVYDNQLLYV